MQPPTISTEPSVSKTGVLVVDGYGIELRVHRSHLVVRDGLATRRRELRFSRATASLKRIVLLGHSGFVSLEAIRWLADVGVPWMHLDTDGRVLGTSSSLGLNDPRLRRAQALSWETPRGLDIARDLLRRKLDGQAQVVRELPGGETTAHLIAEHAHSLDAAATPLELMTVEASAANAYWQVIADVPMPWVRNDVPRVPEHWRFVGQRTSPKSGSPRLAITPAHAMLSYLYALAECEARLACLAVGLDPGLGVLHADQKSRDSLALDVLEAIRPEVDRCLLRLLSQAVFSTREFMETRRGVVRLLPPLTHRLANTVPIWAHDLAPVVERVATTFARGAASVARLPTPLTGANRSAGRDQNRRKPPRIRQWGDPSPARACRGCGVGLEGRRRWCDTCRPAIKLTHATNALAKGRATRARLHKLGLDPSTSADAKAKAREARLRRRAEERTWDEAHPVRLPASRFRDAVLPLLRDVPVRQLARATGLSVTQCAYIRTGVRVPHPRWWEQLTQVALSLRDDRRK